MHRDGRDVTDGIHLPDLLEELRLRVYMIRMRGEEAEKVELLRRKGPLLSVHEYAAGTRIDLQSMNLDDPALLPLPTRRAYRAMCAFTRATISDAENGFVT